MISIIYFKKLNFPNMIKYLGSNDNSLEGICEGKYLNPYFVVVRKPQS